MPFDPLAPPAPPKFNRPSSEPVNEKTTDKTDPADFMSGSMTEPEKTEAGFIPKNEVELDRANRIEASETDSERIQKTNEKFPELTNTEERLQLREEEKGSKNKAIDRIKDHTSLSSILHPFSKSPSSLTKSPSGQSLRTFLVYDADTVLEAEVLGEGENPDSLHLRVANVVQQRHSNSKSIGPTERDFANVRRGTHKRDVGTFFQEIGEDVDSGEVLRANEDDRNQKKIDSQRELDERERERLAVV